MLKDFRQFLLRGNAVDLAVAFVVGAAFQSVVTSIVGNFITPLILAMGGSPSFDHLSFHLHGQTFNYGSVINALISFFIIAAVVYFFVVSPYNRLMRRFKKTELTVKECPECLSEIPTGAARCKFCGVKQPD